MSDVTLTDMERIGAFGEAERTFQMTEEAFRDFYERTSRQLWAFFVRTTGDGRLADDLLQEAYYRFLRARTTLESDDHRRHYLFRIATNLVHDHRRRPSRSERRLDDLPDADRLPADRDVVDRVLRRLDLVRAMARMKPRERSILWLAYAQGFSHEEIARLVGVKKASLKALLFRARRRLLALLQTPRSCGEDE